MVRRSLGFAVWGGVGLLAGFLGALSALIGTSAGRNLVARAAEGALRQVFTGSIKIGDVGGTLLTGLTLSDVRLFDPDTTLVAWLPRAELSYNPLEFAAGRVVLFELALREPLFNIVQHPSGRLNAEELLRLGGPDTAKGPRGPPTLILFRNVRIEDGTVMLRLRARPPPHATHETAPPPRRAPPLPPSRTSGSSPLASPTGRCCTGASRCAPTAAACWRSGSSRSPSPRAAAP